VKDPAKPSSTRSPSVSETAIEKKHAPSPATTTDSAIGPAHTGNLEFRKILNPDSTTTGPGKTARSPGNLWIQPGSLPNLLVQRMCRECADEETLQRLPGGLRVGTPDDQYEKQADAVAQQVTKSSNAMPALPSATSGEIPDLQNKCAECEASESADRSHHASPPADHSAVSRALAATQDGQQLPDNLRSRIEPVLRSDLSQVQVHDSRVAHEAADSLKARAFTHRNHIYLGENQSSSDLGLIAHEATHVVQQAGRLSSPSIQREEKNKDETNSPVNDALAEGDYATVFKLLNGMALPGLLNSVAKIGAATLWVNFAAAKGVNVERLQIAMHAVGLGNDAAQTRVITGMLRSLPADQKQQVIAYLQGKGLDPKLIKYIEQGPKGPLFDAVALGDYAQAFSLLNGMAMFALLPAIESVGVADLQAHFSEAGAIDLVRLQTAMQVVGFFGGAEQTLVLSRTVSTLPAGQQQDISVYLQGRGVAQPVISKLRMGPFDPNKGMGLARDISKLIDFYGDTEPRLRSNQGEYVEALEKSQQADQDLLKGIVETGTPKTDAEKEAFRARVATLIRMRALRLMASHRASIEFERSQTLVGSDEPNGGDVDENPKAKTLAAVRDAIFKVTQLNSVKQELSGYKSNLRSLELSIKQSSSKVDGDRYAEWARTLSENLQYRSGPKIMAYAQRSGHYLSEKNIKDRKLRFLATASGAQKLRGMQIEGVDVAIHVLYRAFPFMSQIDPRDFLLSKDFREDDKLLTAVAKAYTSLVAAVDNAIIKIAGGGIDPFMMPVPVQQVRASLPPELQTELDGYIQDKQVTDFMISLGTTVAEAALVAIPIVGPALAAGVAAGSAGMNLKDLVDRQAIASASTLPDKTMLGVSGPGKLEWALMALEVVMTASDLGAVFKQIRGARGAPGIKSSAGTYEFDADVYSSKPRTTPDGPTDLPDGSIKVKPSDEVAYLEATRMRERLSPQDAANELQLAQQRGSLRASGDPRYIEEIDFNGHTWKRRKDGTGWCRSSPQCFDTDPNAPAAAPKLTEKGRYQWDHVPDQPELPSRPPANDAEAKVREAYRAYYANRVREYQTNKNLSPPRRWDSYYALRRRGAAFEEKVTHTLKQETSLPDEQRGFLAGMKDPVVVDQVTVAGKPDRPGGKLTQSGDPTHKRTDQFAIDRDTVKAGQQPHVQVFSNKSREFGKQSNNQIYSQIKADAQQAALDYGGTIQLRAHKPEIWPLYGQSVKVNKVTLIYDGRIVPDAVKSMPGFFQIGDITVEVRFLM
jgi:hypothetical protein